MTLNRTLILNAIAFVTIYSAAAQREVVPPELQHERDMAVAMLMDASLRYDVPGLGFAQQRLQALLAEPAMAEDAHYFLAFAAWQLGINHAAEPERAKAFIADGLQHLDQVLEGNPDHLDAHLLRLRLYYWQGQLAPEEAARIWPLWGESLAKVRALAPDHPVTLLNLGLAIFHGLRSDPERGVATMEAACKAFETWVDREDPHRVFWYALGCTWLGNHYMLLAEPKVAAAKEAFATALALRTDYALVRDTLLPATETQVVCGVSAVAGLAWTKLADDAEGDGANPALADGRALAYAYDEAKDMLWFQFELFRMPADNGFGVNLVMDTDGDQHNGAAWWGGNRAFRFDRLVTVWVARDGSGQYAGTVGIGEAADIMRGRMTGLARNNIAFTVDQEAKTIRIGFKRAYLSAATNLRFLGAVGSNSRWNDDLPDKETITLTLPPPK